MDFRSQRLMPCQAVTPYIRFWVLSRCESRSFRTGAVGSSKDCHIRRKNRMCQVRDDNPVRHGAIAIRGLDWVQLRSLPPGMVAEAGWLSWSGSRPNTRLRLHGQTVPRSMAAVLPRALRRQATLVDREPSQVSSPRDSQSSRPPASVHSIPRHRIGDD